MFVLFLFVFPTNLRSSAPPKIDVKTLFFFFFFSILHHLSPVIFANATVLAFLLLLGYRFNFHCYIQREPTPIQKSARKRQRRPLATSCAKDYEGHSLVQTSFSEPPDIYRSMAMALLSFQEDLRSLPLSVPVSVRRSMVWCPWFYARREKKI